MVVNGACKVKDMAHFEEQLAAFKAGGGGDDVAMEYLGDDQPLIAVQGPGAAAAVARLVPESVGVAEVRIIQIFVSLYHVTEYSTYLILIFNDLIFGDMVADALYVASGVRSGRRARLPRDAVRVHGGGRVRDIDARRVRRVSLRPAPRAARGRAVRAWRTRLAAPRGGALPLR